METGRKPQFRIGKVENVPGHPHLIGCVAGNRVVDIRAGTGQRPGLSRAGRCILSKCTRG
jgi:hypothetical protein